MQHKVVCKQFLKMVCGSSVLFIRFLQVSQSVRCTSAPASNYYKSLPCFYTAPDSLILHHGTCFKTHTLRLCEGLEFEIRLPGGNAEKNVIMKLSKFFLERVKPQTKADSELQPKSQCPAKLLQTRCLAVVLILRPSILLFL